ncbi:MAG TPA: glycine cleavage T C-terminal barrel domain-containing protein [Solirubrobacteraceae bacterium]|jgi:folate-binding protein YgfZ|nr:glycine cleavage T C-terminal barrel domain-containing protein [Solirubrobacteraceae bacterium]
MALTAADAAYAALTETCGWGDRSERGKLLLTGADAAEFLTGQVSNDIVGLEPGHGCYAALLTPKGKMVADLRVLRLGADAGPEAGEGAGLWLDTERSALQTLFETLYRHRIGHRVTLHKRTLERSLISLIGPRAPAVAAGLTGLDAEELPRTEHDHRNAAIGGVRALLVATDTGLDLIVASEDHEAVRQALSDAGVSEVGEGDTEVIRVEHGRPRYGVDLDDSVIPQEAGLNDRAVSFTKGCYVGQETVARLHYRGKPNRRLRGLRLSGPAQGGEELHHGEKVVGRLTSPVTSPRLGPLALALVRREVEPGEHVRVGEGALSAEVVELPFA